MAPFTPHSEGRVNVRVRERRLKNFQQQKSGCLARANATYWSQRVKDTDMIEVDHDERFFPTKKISCVRHPIVSDSSSPILGKTRPLASR